MKFFKNLFGRSSTVKKRTPVPHMRPACDCFRPDYDNTPYSELRFHSEQQDTKCDSWKELLEDIDAAWRDGAENLDLPGLDSKIITLPKSIAKLKRVKRLLLYGSFLVRIPPEIGEMSALTEFIPYTSYRLHWFPYEITRCKKLMKSCISTRALYGNYKNRPPFPLLPSMPDGILPETCSVCLGPFKDAGPLQYWISLKVATDVMPLLVHACSMECVNKLPAPHSNYVSVPHQGGLELKQPVAKLI